MDAVNCWRNAAAGGAGRGGICCWNTREAIRPPALCFLTHAHTQLVAPAICLPGPEFHSPVSFKIIPFRRQCRSAFNLSQNELDSIVSPLVVHARSIAGCCDGLVRIRRQLMTLTWRPGLFFRISFSSWAAKAIWDLHLNLAHPQPLGI